MKLQTKKFSIDAYVRGDSNAANCALILPGFLDTKDYFHVRSHVESLAEKGFYALGIDFPGTWGSSGDITDYTVSNCHAVILELMSLLNRPTLLIGHSNGGRLALQAAAESEQILGVVSIMAPFHVMRSNTKSERMQKWRTEGVRHVRMDLPENPEQFKDYAVPYSFLLDSEKYSPAQYITLVKQPKLFIAGQLDEVILPSEVEEAFQCAVRPKKYELLDAGHIYRKDKKAVTKVNQLLRDFSRQWK